MQQHLGRQDGVEKVEVSLADGKVVIYPKEDATVNPAAIFKAVYDSGVSVAEMTLTATGELVKDPAKGGLVFATGNNQVFEVKPNAISQKLEEGIAPGKTIRLRGLLYRKPAGKAKRKVPASLPLEILELLN